MSEKEKKRKNCVICGGVLVPTSNNQKYCPNCRDMLAAGKQEEKMKAYAVKALPGEVTTYTVDVKLPPEATMSSSKDEAPPLPEGWMEEQKKLQLPDWDAFVMQAMEILIRYGRGELVDKSELLEEIREKLMNI